MSNYKIENVGTPPRSKSGRARKYPFDDMGVGDSFFVPYMRPSGLGGSIKLASQRLGYKFCTRSEVSDGIRGIRVYRIK